MNSGNLLSKMYRFFFIILFLGHLGWSSELIPLTSEISPVRLYLVLAIKLGLAICKTNTLTPINLKTIFLILEHADSVKYFKVILGKSVY